MPQDWDVLEFIERVRDGELDDQLGEALESLTPEQMEELKRYLQMQLEIRRKPRRGAGNS